jgi:8-oxo-dGTP pyrophosphatase MutT (NUDIX family)
MGGGERPAEEGQRAMNVGEFLFRGLWREDEVDVRWMPEIVRATTPFIEAEITRKWESLVAERRFVYDGRLCRLIGYTADAGRVGMTTGPTSYREYHGTRGQMNLDDSQRANPLCVCCVAHTSDDKLLLGRRSDAMAESAGLWHVVGGHIEADRHRDNLRLLPFQAMRDELSEELGVDAGDIVDLRCMGLTRPEDTLKPELLFYAVLRRRASDLRPDIEHVQLLPIDATAPAARRFAEERLMVAAGRACLRAYADILE